MLEHLPDDCSTEDVQYHLHVLQKLEARSQRADQGVFVSQSEAERKMRRWLL
jgi:hypothetical protein